MIRVAGAFAWDVLAVAGGLRACAALAAVIAYPQLLQHVNSGGVALSVQLLALSVLLAAAVATWGDHPVRRAWASTWAIGAGEFGTGALLLAGWGIPSFLATLWVLIPAAVGASLAVAVKPVFNRRPFRPAVVSASGLVVAVAVIILIDLQHAGPAVQLGFWAALTLGAGASVLALRRRHRVQRLHDRFSHRPNPVGR